MIPADVFGKLKTVTQVAMVMALIAVKEHPLWVSLLVYVTVVITVLSGAEYLFGVSRSRVEPRSPARM